MEPVIKHIIDFVRANPISSFCIAWLLSNMVSMLPTPKSDSSSAYRSFFGLAHLVFGNGARIVKTVLRKLPAVQAAELLLEQQQEKNECEIKAPCETKPPDSSQSH
jgi:hypothetical protein